MVGQHRARRVAATTAFVLSLAITGSGTAVAAAPRDGRDIPAAQRSLADEFGGFPRGD